MIKDTLTKALLILFLQPLVWLLGRTAIYKLIMVIIKAITKPFYFLLDLLPLCENDKNSYDEQLRKAIGKDFLDSLD